MDCAAEEQLVRMALAHDSTVHAVDVDLHAREVAILHGSDVDAPQQLLVDLGLGARLLDSKTDVADATSAPQRDERRTLRLVLAINGAMFVGEAFGGFLADSSALLADSLDMLADAMVYAIALYGASSALATQRRAARLSGLIQFGLAIGALGEVARRVVMGSDPEPGPMVGIAAAALTANAASMWLLYAHRGDGAHMKASWIFTTNDVLANIGVIVGALLVRVIGSAWPDLVVGAGIAGLVLSGAVRIFQLR
jgi:Co/Zn/Cd efflux system component